MTQTETAGMRMRARRRALQMTQKNLADVIGVSHVAISQWEKEETVPRGENLLRLAEHLQCTPAWIIDGDGEPFAPPSNISQGRAVPLVALSQAANGLHTSAAHPQRAVNVLYTDLPLSEQALAVALEDDAMQPEWRPGDRLIFDAAVTPRPGEVVLAVVNGQAQVRVYQVTSQQGDEASVSLRPLNADFPSYSATDNHLVVIGTLREMRRTYLPASPCLSAGG
ncbi:helix-turn-helix domain-containing protein [Pantoea eucrina]|uniref:Helix-turn-helix domain-containing protein n=1 Tax=Pantoea eucrina TaxID=472693 RepID=A0ABU5LDQ2_9GAMM|nr:helix-turn-helix domain-containing protein [Pantoea eucrina]MDZ7278084.1 helix-turn-helix domain-containing protein [Pantoea eucrina]